MLYLLQSPSDNCFTKLYKVGYASDFKRRLSSYRGSNPKIKVIFTREGNKDLESLFHKFFHTLSDIKFISNEWYEVDLYDNRLVEYFSMLGYNELLEGIGYIKSFKDGLSESVDSDLLSTAQKIIVDGIIKELSRSGRFSKKLEFYCNIRETNKENLELTNILLSYFQNSIFENYYSHFGLKKCKAVSFKEAELKRLLETESKQNSLMAALYQRFPVNQVYTLKDIKENLKDIYKTLGMSKTPKATDLLDYFNIQEKMITDKTTKRRVLCYQIISIR